MIAAREIRFCQMCGVVGKYLDAGVCIEAMQCAIVAAGIHRA